MSDTFDPDLAAERAVLGALLLAPERIPDVAHLNPCDLQEDRSRVLLVALRELDDRGTPIDLVTLGSALRSAGKLRAVGGPKRLCALAGSVTTAQHLLAHVEQVRVAACERRVSDAAARVASSTDARERADAERALREALDAKALLGVQAVAEVEPRESTPQFPLDALPQVLRDFTEAKARALDVDPSMVALPTLVATAGAIGATRLARVKRGHTAPAVLWGAIVSPPSFGKTPALAGPFEPLHAEDARLAAEYRRARGEFELKLAAYEQRTRATRKRDASDIAEQPPRPPAREHVVVDSFTLEGLGVALVDSPRGVVAVVDELAGWVEGFDAYRGGKGGDEARWLSIYDAGPFKTLRAARERGLDIPRAAVSLCGGLQPEVARRLFTREHVGNGLLARLLVVWPPRIAQRPTTYEVPEPVEAAYASTLQRLRSLEVPPHSEGEPPPPPLEVVLTGEARELYFEFAHECADGMDAAGDDDAAGLGKAKGYAVRLALVVHLARWASGENVRELALDSDSMRAGIALARYFAGQASRLLEGLAASPEVREREALAAWIARQPNGQASERDLMTRGPNRRTRFPTVDRARASLQALADARLGTWAWLPTGPNGGRPERVLRAEAGRGTTLGAVAQPLPAGSRTGVPPPQSVPVLEDGDALPMVAEGAA